METFLKKKKKILTKKKTILKKKKKNKERWKRTHDHKHGHWQCN